MKETIIETKACKTCSKKFHITDKDFEFYDKVSPIFNGIKYNIPNPTLCPECRQQRRFSRRNEKKLYRTICDLTKKPIISIYSPEKPYKIYDQKEWRSDKWNPMEYGKDFDFNKTFFEQFHEILFQTPQASLANDYMNNENSEYINASGPAKDCYLLFENGSNENCMFGYNIYYSKNCLETSFITECENCYECMDVHKSYSLYYSTNCNNCSNCYFLDNCTNCKNCFFCFGLQNKLYCINNQQYSPEEYKDKLSKIDILSYSGIKKLYSQFLEERKNHITKYYIGNQNENVIGNYLFNSKDLKNCFDITDCSNSAYLSQFSLSDTCYDCDSWGSSKKSVPGATLCYECHSVGNSVSKICFSYSCWGGAKDTYYSYQCLGGGHLFGCISLTNREYCILNKQYTKKDYDALVPKIIEHMRKTGEWGEFFPISQSLFGYNETKAMDYFPITIQEAKEKGYKWQEKEYPINVPEGTETINSKEVPEFISQIDDTILKKAIICEITGKPFRITKAELEFYRKHSLPLPKRHPDQRHLDRFANRNPRKIYDRKCSKCSIDIKTTYSIEKSKNIYCESCYNKEIYGYTSPL